MKDSSTAQPSHRARGFTIIELLVSIALASMVTAAVSSIFLLLREANTVTAIAAERSVERARSHATLQRTFASLVAASPIRQTEPVEDDDREEGDSPSRVDDLALQPDLLGELGVLFDSGSGAGVDARLNATIAAADTSQPPFFELYYESVSAGAMGQVNLPRLAVTVTRLPVDTRTDQEQAMTAKWRGISRGVFELLFDPETAGWILAFTPTDPAGKPSVLLRQLRFAEFTVLEPDEEQTELRSDQSQSEWRSLYASYLRQDFPDAVRFYAETQAGQIIDWLFETTVLTEGGR